MQWMKWGSGNGYAIHMDTKSIKMPRTKNIYHGIPWAYKQAAYQRCPGTSAGDERPAPRPRASLGRLSVLPLCNSILIDGLSGQTHDIPLYYLQPPALPANADLPTRTGPLTCCQPEPTIDRHSSRHARTRSLFQTRRLADTSTVGHQSLGTSLLIFSSSRWAIRPRHPAAVLGRRLLLRYPTLEKHLSALPHAPASWSSAR